MNNPVVKRCASPSNSIQSSLVYDALQRPVPEINGMPINSSTCQFLPNTDPRLPAVGKYTLGNYANYTPSAASLAKLPNWRENRVQQRESTQLERELALEEQAASQRLRAARDEHQRSIGANAEGMADQRGRNNSAEYRLNQSSPREQSGARPLASTGRRADNPTDF